MKNLSFFNKIILLLNIIFAVLLLFSYCAPYIKPSSVSIFPLLSLITPILIVINILFVLYWTLIGFKRPMALSLFVLIIGLFIISSIYKFGINLDSTADEELTIMTYNVRKFNLFKWIDDKNISSKIQNFINNEKPDILVLQEFKYDPKFKIEYPYIYNPTSKGKAKSGFAIYSKYEIINTGLIKYYPEYGYATYADIIKKKDTLRVYNLHLHSLGLIPDEEYFGH